MKIRVLIIWEGSLICSFLTFHASVNQPLHTFAALPYIYTVWKATKLKNKNLYFKLALLIPMESTNAFHSPNLLLSFYVIVFPPIAQLHPSLHKLHTAHIPLIALTRGQCLKSQLWKLFVVWCSKTPIQCYSNDHMIEKITWITDLWLKIFHGIKRKELIVLGEICWYPGFSCPCRCKFKIGAGKPRACVYRLEMWI